MNNTPPPVHADVREIKSKVHWRTSSTSHIISMIYSICDSYSDKGEYTRQFIVDPWGSTEFLVYDGGSTCKDMPLDLLVATHGIEFLSLMYPGHWKEWKHT